MSHPLSPPLPFIENWLPQDLTGQDVLDYACGSGRHGRLALTHGAHVTFVDKDLSQVTDLLTEDNLSLLQADLEQPDFWPISGRQYDLVIVTNYLYRPRLADILGLIRPNGLLLYQTFARGNEVFGKPSNPDFLLEAGELRQACRLDFDILGFEQGMVEQPSSAVTQRIAARRH